MGLKSTIQKAVDTAFAKVDDLLVDVVFQNNEATDFDFATQTVIGASSDITTRGLRETKKSYVAGSVTSVLTLTVKNDGFKFNGYTLVSVAGVLFRCSVMEANDFVTTFQLTAV